MEAMRGITALLLLAAVVLASSMSSISRGDITFGIDTAVFSLGSDGMAVEVYQEMEVGQLARDSSGWAYFVTQIILLDQTGDTVAVDQWASTPEWAEGRRLVNQTVLPVTPGEFELEVLVTDMNNGLQGSLTRQLDVEEVGDLSELELARVVIPCEPASQNRLRKGGVLVYPAAAGRFMLPSSPLVYIYAELYDHGGTGVSQRTTLRSPQGSVIFARPWKNMSVPEGASAVGLMDSISLGAARTPGLYTVEMAVAIPGDTLRRAKPLMIGFEEPPTTETVESGPADGERRIDEMRWVLNGQEREILGDLETTEQRNAFYDEYWAGSQQQRRQFEQRCEEAEEFGNQFTAGWRTDRGRVTIVYGSPDDVERDAFSIDALPHEIWYYDSGNEQFVFADRTGDGIYEQIYSTVDGEVSYENWQEMIQTVRNRQGGL